MPTADCPKNANQAFAFQAPTTSWVSARGSFAPVDISSILAADFAGTRSEGSTAERFYFEPSGQHVETIFGILAERLERETLVLSNPSQMLRHPDVAELRKLGADVLVSNALRRIDGFPVIWMSVLSEVTGENPVPERDWGKIRAMTEHWKKWGRARHLLD
jgi:hypothetical protein